MKVRAKLIIYILLATSLIIILSYSDVFIQINILQNRETTALETLIELNTLNEIKTDYNLLQTGLLKIIFLENNITEYLSQLQSFSKTISNLLEIEKQPFEQIALEVNEEEISGKISESWEELFPKYVLLTELADNETYSENSTMVLTEALEDGKFLENLIDQRMDSENTELEERTKFTKELVEISSIVLYLETATALVLSILGGIVISRSIVNPINRLIKATQRISAGNYDVQISSDADDEIGILSRQFSEMNEKVRFSNEHLNLLVQNKTRDLELANENLKRKDQLKDEFISIASHELKTPVHPILELAEAAKEGLISNEEAWDLLFKHAKRLQHLTNNILDISRIDANELSYHFEKTSINQIIRNIVNQIPEDINKDLQIELILDKEIEIYGDKDRLIQIFENLIDNARKFTIKGMIKIETIVFDKMNRMQIRISDTGVGIPPEILPNIFDKFVTKGDSGGTGLGLYICKAIVIAHDGEIFANNNDRGGATFTIILPIMTKNENAISNKVIHD